LLKNACPAKAGLLPNVCLHWSSLYANSSPVNDPDKKHTVPINRIKHNNHEKIAHPGSQHVLK
jgi:hypothetical protein